MIVMATGGASVVDVAGVVSVAVRSEDVARIKLIAPVYKSRVLRALEITKQMLHRVPVLDTGISDEATECRDGERDVGPS